MEEPAIADRAPDAVASDSASPAAGAGAGARVAPANYPSGYRAARRAELVDLRRRHLATAGREWLSAGLLELARERAAYDLIVQDLGRRRERAARMRGSADGGGGGDTDAECRAIERLEAELEDHRQRSGVLAAAASADALGGGEGDATAPPGDGFASDGRSAVGEHYERALLGLEEAKRGILSSGGEGEGGSGGGAEGGAGSGASGVMEKMYLGLLQSRPASADEDDGMRREELRLGAAEASLREELDMAGGLGDLMRSPIRIPGGLSGESGAASGSGSSDGTLAPPRDVAWVSATFCLLGVGILLPWNAFISAEPYFNARLCALYPGGEGGDIELFFGLVFNSMGFGCLAFLTFKQLRGAASGNEGTGTFQVDEEGTPSREETEGVSVTSGVGEENGTNLAARRQVLASLSLYLAMFLVTTALVLSPDVDAGTFLGLTLLSLAVFGACLALAGTGIVGVAGVFPPSMAIGPFFVGQAMGGVFVSALNFALSSAESPEKFWREHCKDGKNRTDYRYWSSEPDNTGCLSYEVDWATFTYFFLGCALLMACIYGFIALERSDVTAYYRLMARRGGDGGPPRGQGVADSDALLRTPPRQSGLDNISSLVSMTPSRDDMVEPLLSGEEGRERSMRIQDESVTVESVYMAIKLPAMAIFLTTLVTLIIFPAWSSNIESAGVCVNSGRLANDLFEPLSFLIFNIPDFGARKLASAFIDVSKMRNGGGKLLVSIAAARLIFLPLFLLCKSSSSIISVTIDSDAFAIGLSLAFSFTNGALMALCFMLSPQLLPSTERAQQLGSTVMNLCLASGLLLGSCLSFVYMRLATGEWK